MYTVVVPKKGPEKFLSINFFVTMTGTFLALSSLST